MNENFTFFKGEDFLSSKTRDVLNDFFNAFPSDDLITKLKDKLMQNNLLNDENQNIFGLRPYVRKDFVYNIQFKTSSLDSIFDKELNEKWENNVIDMLKGENE